MQNKSLTELIHGLEQEMLRLGYTNGSLQFYRRRWKMLHQFAQERGESFYSERLGIDFVENIFTSSRKILVARFHNQILRICALLE